MNSKPQRFSKKPSAERHLKGFLSRLLQGENGWGSSQVGCSRLDFTGVQVCAGGSLFERDSVGFGKEGRSKSDE